MTAPLLLKGLPGSPYTRKMLAILRYRHIDYNLLFPGSARLTDLPKPRVELLPTFFLQDAAGAIEAVTEKVDAATDATLVQWLAADGKLVKRPVLVDGQTVLIGFKEEQWASHFSK